MNIMKKTVLMLLWGTMALGLASCNKFLDVVPEDRFLQEGVFSNELSVNNALNGIYLNLAKTDLYGGQLTMSTVDIMAQYYLDRGGAFPWKWQQLSAYNYNDAGVQVTYNTIWRSAYVAILNTNSFLTKTDKSVGVITAERKNLLMGEAYGLRAFIHFDMLRLFGPVYLSGSDNTSIPYMTQATEKIQPLLPAKAVVDSVLADLDKAEKLLKNDPVRTQGVVAVTGTDPTADFVKLRNRRLNYYAVLGIKARVLLYKGDKANAFAVAKQVIDEAGKWFDWTIGDATLPRISDPDRTFSGEVIFGLQNYELYNQQRSFFSATLQDVDILAPDAERLLEIFEKNENDYRFRVNWVLNPATQKGYKTFVKYEDVVTQALLFRNMQPLVRISELYYIAAECTTDPGLALYYINTVRKNRGLGNLSGSVNMDNELQKEYQREFWGEGQTFYYYKRKALNVIPAGANNVSIQMTPLKYVVPLPLSETQNR